jgi:hypothetical protein
MPNPIPVPGRLTTFGLKDIHDRKMGDGGVFSMGGLTLGRLLFVFLIRAIKFSQTSPASGKLKSTIKSTIQQLRS